MSNKKDMEMVDTSQGIDQTPFIDAPGTPQRAMELLMLSELKSPSYSEYDAATSLAAARLMRQVIENRKMHPALYDAPGAKNEIGIIKAPGQFQDFEHYPFLPKYKLDNTNDAISKATGEPGKQRDRFVQYLKNVQLAATEDITKPVAEFANVTVWMTDSVKGHKPNPGPGFTFSVDIGGNRFYSTNFVGMAHHHAAIARQNAANERAKQPWYHHVAAAPQRSFAPPARRHSQAPKQATPHTSSSANFSPQINTSSASQPTHPGTLPPANTVAKPPADAVSTNSTPAYNLLSGDFHANLLNSPMMQLVSRLSASGSTAFLQSLSRHPKPLPSIAPIRRHGHEGVFTMSQLAALKPGPAPQAAPKHSATVSSPSHATRSHAAPSTTGDAHTQTSAAPSRARDVDIQKAIRDYFNAQARLPPSGPTAFDPYLTPAWAGMKIPLT